MGIFDRLFRRNHKSPERRSIENPAYSLDDPEMWDALVGDEPGAAGVRVTAETALKLSPVWRGVFLIANTVAKLPLYVYERDADGEGKHYATDHPAYPLLRRKPSPELTAFVFKQVVTAQAILMGNGYAFIGRLGNGSPRELLPFPPGTCHPVRVGGVLYYVYTPVDGSAPRKMVQEDVYHIRGPGLDGLCGISLTRKAKDSVGSGLAAQTYAAKFFANGAEPRVIFETANKLTGPQRDQIKAMWQTMHAGLENFHKSGILEHGVTIKAFGADPETSQLLETRKFTPIDVANWLHLPPHKLGEMTGRAFASLEQDNQSFLDDSMEPWLVQHEEQCWDKLLTEQEKRSDSHTVEFMRLALMRADAAARGAFYHNAKLDGWMCDDEIRARENLNPIPGGKGKVFYRPLNMVPVGREQEEKDEEFQRKAWLGFQADGTVSDVMANLTDMKALTAAVGLPVEPDYTDPWLPVVAQAGPLVTGNPIKDSDGDIVGSGVKAVPGAAPTAGVVPPVTKKPIVDPASPPAIQKQSVETRPVAINAALLVATRQLMLDATGRMVRRLRTHAVKAAKSPGGVSEFLGRGIDEHRAVMVETIRPALDACAMMRGLTLRTEIIVDGLLAEFRRRVAATDGTAEAVEAALATREIGESA